MNKLNSQEITVLRYIAGGLLYNQDGTNTFVQILSCFSNSKFTAICDSLEEKGMIQTAYCEGHILQDARILDKGQCYLDDLLEEQKDLSNHIKHLSIGKSGVITYWNNGELGKITDLESKGEFRFFDYLDSYTIHPKYCGFTNERANSRIIATGIVGWWLHHYLLDEIGDIKYFYRNYTEKCFQEFKKERQSDPLFMNVDLRKIYFSGRHQSDEKALIKQSEALYPFLTDNDVFKIKNMIDGYWTFIKEEFKTVNNQPISLSSFLNLFGTDGTAYKCLCVMEKKYDFFVDRNDAEMLEYKTDGYDSLNSTQIYNESINIDFNIFSGQEIPLMNEVKQILENKSDDELDRLLLRVFTSLELFGRLMYPFARCKSHFLRLQDLIKKRPKEPVKNDYYDRTIAYHKEEVRKFQNNSQKFKDLFIEDGAPYRYLETELEWYMCRFMSLYVSFVKNLDAMLMIYGKDLIEFEHNFDIYLCQPMKDVDLCGVQHLSTSTSVRYYYAKLANRAKQTEKEDMIMNGCIDLPANIEFPNNNALELQGNKEHPIWEYIQLPGKEQIIIDCLTKLVKSKKKPKDQLAPIKAALEYKPRLLSPKITIEVINKEFGYNISIDTFKNWIKGNRGHKYSDEELEPFKEIFHVLICPET